MEALYNIASRATPRQLGGGAPSQIEIRAMMNCAVNAPDHGRLRPWRFLVIMDEGLTLLGEVFAAASCNAGSATANAERAKALRSPLLIVAIYSPGDETRISEFEQLLSVGAAVENCILAAGALGYGAMWKTGRLACDPEVRAALGLAQRERIAGFIHIGTAAGPQPMERLKHDAYVSNWPALPEGLSSEIS